MSKKFNYSAIGSWSGYIYQGMCAAYVVLNSILDEYRSKGNVDQIRDYLLYLDAYDDFSIHDKNNQAISLHQCKLYKQIKTFEGAQEQLIETKRYWVQKNVCTEDTVVYFHSNQQPDLMDGISFFEDFEGDRSFEADKLCRKICKIIVKIFEAQGVERAQNRVYNALISWIDTQVITIHGKYREQKETLQKIAIDKASAIPFNKIISLLFDDVFETYPPLNFYRLLKYEFLHSIKEEIEEIYETEDDWGEGSPEFVQELVDCIGKTPIVNFEHIVQRLLPTEGILPSEKSERNVCNSSVAQELIQLVANCRFRLGSELDWNERSKRQTPIAVKHLPLYNVCKQLYKNRANLDCLREYDILVMNDGKYFIPDIKDRVRSIMQVNNTGNNDNKNIFKEKKVGLLSLNRFNGEDYE